MKILKGHRTTMINLIDSKVCIIADLHLGVHQNSPTWHRIAIQFATHLNEELQKLDIKDIIILGDVFHDDDEISVSTLSVASQFFDILKNYNIIIIVGNHDAYYKTRIDTNSIDILHGRNNITIISQVEQLQHEDATFDIKKLITFCPWGIPIEKIPKGDILFGHFEIENFKMNAYKICSKGLSSTDLLNRAQLIMSGHFHLREEREYKQGNIVYVGDPYQQNWGEVDCDKGFYILDLLSHKYEFHPNTISPLHHKIELSQLNKLEVDELKQTIRNNIIEFIVDKKNIDQEKINLLTSKLKQLDPISFIITWGEKEQLQLDDIDYTFTTTDMEAVFKNFIDELDCEYKDLVLNYILNVYNKVNS